ncbi:MAG: anaerobic sulfatase maturase [Acidobacteriota bacterium]
MQAPEGSKTRRSFQIFAKPAGAACNLRCRYCYYLSKAQLGRGRGPSRMPEDLLEEYIRQQIEASPDEVIRFSWHGGEPTLLGLDYFRLVVEIQRRHCPVGRVISNGIQTNGTLLDERWGKFLAEESFAVGLSLDGPREMHDWYRTTRDGNATFDQTIRGYEVLRRHGVLTDILCVVSACNVSRPAEVYGFFKQIGASYVSFLPLVERCPDGPGGVSIDSVEPKAWGDFLCAVFDEWVSGDIGRIKVQIIEEAARTAFGQEHSLCLFRPTCGDIPVVERNGDFYCCDHFVDAGHLVGNLLQTPLVELLESPVQRAFGSAKLQDLPGNCGRCEVRDMCHGECPRNRFIPAPDGGPALNYLCAGYHRFFTHVAPFVAEVARQWRQGKDS